MQPWNCCRTCLNMNFLNPIFFIPEQNTKYSEILLNTTGVKIEHQDNLPQLICTECVNLINTIIKFRKNCLKTQNILLEKLNNRQFHVIIKTETEHAKSELVTIDINDYLNDNSHFENDYCDDNDDVPLINEPKHKIDDKTNEVSLINDKNLRSSKRKINIVKKRVKKKNIENDTPNRNVTSVREIKDTVESEDRKGEVVCEYCHKVLTSKLSLRNHYKIHTGFDVVCEHCGKKFITRRLLLMHCRAKHGYEKTDKCSYCDYKASNAEQVKIHERLHTGEKPYICKECSAGFHRKSSYLQHIAIHLPEKTVQCDQCPARFKSVTLMRIHKNRHRQTRYSFKCYICQSDFARRRNVIRHLHRIHAVSAPNVTEIERVKIG